MVLPGSLLGIGICLVSSVVSNLGLIIVKSVVTRAESVIVVVPPDVAADRRFDRNGSRRNSSFLEDVRLTEQTAQEVLSSANVIWIAGLAVFFLGQVLNMVALGFLPEAVWAVVSLFSLVSNAFFSTTILGETAGKSDLYSTLLILVGSALVAVAVPNESKSGAEEWTESVFLSHFTRPLFLAYCAVLGTVLVASILRGIRAVGKGHTVEALTWTTLSAACGAVSVLLGKCIMGILKTAYGTEHGTQALFQDPTAYIIFGIFLSAAILALVSLNLALAVGDALLVVPCMTVLNTILAILGGMCYFEEFSVFRSMPRAVLFCAGVSLAIVGSVTLQQSRGGGNIGHVEQRSPAGRMSLQLDESVSLTAGKVQQRYS